MVSVLLFACSTASPPGPTGSSTSALSSAQCSYFDVNGSDTICHATGSTKNPYVLLKTSESGCVSGHSTHANDFIDVNGSNCNNAACLPIGAPCDATLGCCTGLCSSGTCTCSAAGGGCATDSDCCAGTCGGGGTPDVCGNSLPTWGIAWGEFGCEASLPQNTLACDSGAPAPLYKSGVVIGNIQVGFDNPYPTPVANQAVDLTTGVFTDSACTSSAPASFGSDPINLTTDANGQLYVNHYFITLASGAPAGNYYIGAFSNGGVYGMGRSCFGPLYVNP